jgi:hypothetical protein
MAQQFGSPKAGDSAYQVAVNNGFSLDEVEWLKSLKGEASTDAAPSVVVTTSLGQSTTEAVSQKLLTDVLGDIEAVLTELNGELQ